MTTPSSSDSGQLLLIDRVRKDLLIVGESHYRERKSALEGLPDAKKKRDIKEIIRDIAKTLVAFANADGGVLFVGVEDDGTVTGLPHTAQEIDGMLRPQHGFIQRSDKSPPLPLQQAAKVSLDGKEILYFVVAKGTETVYQTFDGKCYRRQDRESAPAVFHEIQISREEQRSREFDRQFVDGVGVSDLDQNLLRDLANRFQPGMSVDWYLQQTQLAEFFGGVLRLRQAAVLLFGKNNHHRRQSYVRVVVVDGTELGTGAGYKGVSDQRAEGNIFELLKSGWELLSGHLVVKTRFTSDARFEQEHRYPEEACREALVNALAHRDYCNHLGIEIFIFTDRIEFRSPGALLSTVKESQLLELAGRHESRNPNIMRILRVNNYVREMGEGMKRMFDAMEEREYREPEIHSNTYSFRVTLRAELLFTAEQREWLNQFTDYTLTRLQRAILVAGMRGRLLSTSDIWHALRTKDQAIFTREIDQLRKSSLLEEVRARQQRKELARTQGVDVDKVSRFRVCVPEKRQDDPVVQAQAEAVLPVGTLPDAPKHVVYVSAIPGSWEEPAIWEAFKPYGQVLSVNLVRHADTGKPRGYAFVEFARVESVTAAIATPPKLPTGSTRLNVSKPRTDQGGRPTESRKQVGKSKGTTVGMLSLSVTLGDRLKGKPSRPGGK